MTRRSLTGARNGPRTCDGRHALCVPAADILSRKLARTHKFHLTAALPTSRPSRQQISHTNLRASTTAVRAHAQRSAHARGLAVIARGADKSFPAWKAPVFALAPESVRHTDRDCAACTAEALACCLQSSRPTPSIMKELSTSTRGAIATTLRTQVCRKTELGMVRSEALESGLCTLLAQTCSCQDIKMQLASKSVVSTASRTRAPMCA